MKTIPGFPNYSITQEGRVWSKPRITPHGHKRKGRWLKSPCNTYGYPFVTLYINAQKYLFFVHRLVLETYIGNCPSDMQCRHLDGNKQNNRLDNLCWGTPKENGLDSIRQGVLKNMRGELNGHAKLTETKVRVIRYLRDVAKFSLKDIAWQFDVTIATICDICKRRSWKYLDAKV